MNRVLKDVDELHVSWGRITITNLVRLVTRIGQGAEVTP
jgi:hypothetical protein